MPKISRLAPIALLLFAAACGASGQYEGSIGGSDRVLEGQAAYYSDSLAGNSTASGEPYDPSRLTAASRDLPFGTRVRVTRLDREGNAMGSVEVRINDRGPFGNRRRIIDLSRAAAEELEMIRAGVVPVRLEILSVPEPRQR